MSDRWLRYFELPRRDPRRDVDDEIRFHLEERVADLVRRGHAPEAARERATREFGDAHLVRDQTLAIDSGCCGAAIGRSSSAICGATRASASARSGRRRPSPSPRSSAPRSASASRRSIVSATYAVLIRPLPYPNADRLVAVYGENTARGYHGTNISWPDYRSWREDTRTLEALGIWTWITATLSDDATEAERVSGAWVSASLFPALGVRPLIGRGFTDERGDARPRPRRAA